MAVNIAADSTRAIHYCDSDARLPYTQRLSNTSFVLVEYLQNKRDSKDVLQSSIDLRRMVQEFNKEQNTSIRYCVHKLSNIQAASRMLARGIALAAQFDPCAGDPKQRLKVFTTSYEEGALTDIEFKNLAGDVLRLQNINTVSCSLENRRQLQEAVELATKIISAL